MDKLKLLNYEDDCVRKRYYNRTLQKFDVKVYS